MAERQAQPPWLASAFIGVTVALAVATASIAWIVGGPPRDAVATLVLAVLVILSQLLRVNLLARVSFALGGVVSLAAYPLIGPFGGALVNAVASGVELGPRPPRARVFNIAMSTACGALGGLTYHWTGGAAALTDIRGAAEIVGRVGLPLMLGAVVQTLSNTMLLGGIVWADQGMPFRSFVVSALTTTGIAQVGYSVVGLLLVILWVPAGVGPFSALLILLPLFVARWAFVQSGEERAAHERTLAAFVAAAGARYPDAVGHSERVAQLAEGLGRQLGFGPAQTTTLRYAALLHDIGWIGAPADVHARPDSRGTALLAHPESGVELLAEISFLQDCLPGIRHHHERYDGTGFPDGLVGEAIPAAARVIAVADAFDALTSHRPTRAALEVPDALAVLRDATGTHLDPEVVAALERVVERQPWTGGQLVAPDGDPFVDHDLPRASVWVADGEIQAELR